MDATTVNKDNFEVTIAGTEVPVVEDAVYHASANEVRLYLSDGIEGNTSPYTITSENVEDTDGNPVELSGESYFISEETADLYDISIANIWFKNGDATYFTQPKSGSCDVHVRVVNSSYESKTATLQILAVGTGGDSRAISKEEITLARETEITKVYEDLTIVEGEKLDIKLLK